MSEDHFEVLNLDLIEELRVLRKFAYEMIALSSIHDMPVPHEMESKIDAISKFYNDRAEKDSV